MLSELETIGATLTGPWIVLRDFNCIANLKKRIGQKSCLNEIEPLRQCMGNCEIYDLKSTRRFFTWSNKKRGEARVLSKIDRVMGNPVWESLFPTTEVYFLSEGYFHHTSMLVQFLEPPKRKKPCKFLNHWGKHRDFIETIREAWRTRPCGNSNHLDHNLKLVKEACKARFKNTEAANMAKNTTTSREEKKESGGTT